MSFKNKLTSFCNKFFFPVCVFFTLITLGFFIISDLSNPNQTVVEHFHFKKVIFFFIFSIVLALANRILYAKNLPLFVRILIHFFVTALTLLILLIADGYVANNGGSKLLIFLAIYAIVYIFCGFGVYIFRRLTGFDKNATEKQKNDYKKQF